MREVKPNKALQRRPRSTVHRGSHSAVRGPAERGRWAPRAQPLMSVAVLTGGLAGVAPPAHATATRPLRPSPDATACAACMCCMNDPPPTAVEDNGHLANSGLAGRLSRLIERAAPWRWARGCSPAELAPSRRRRAGGQLEREAGRRGSAGAQAAC